jgi:hypothetical protein
VYGALSGKPGHVAASLAGKAPLWSKTLRASGGTFVEKLPLWSTTRRASGGTSGTALASGAPLMREKEYQGCLAHHNWLPYNAFIASQAIALGIWSIKGRKWYNVATSLM